VPSVAEALRRHHGIASFGGAMSSLHAPGTTMAIGPARPKASPHTNVTMEDIAAPWSRTGVLVRKSSVTDVRVDRESTRLGRATQKDHARWVYRS